MFGVRDEASPRTMDNPDIIIKLARKVCVYYYFIQPIQLHDCIQELFLMITTDNPDIGAAAAAEGVTRKRLPSTSRDTDPVASRRSAPLCSVFPSTASSSR